MAASTTSTTSPLDSARRVARRARRRVQRATVAIRGQRVITILGMHRSGTSSLAGSLEEAGLYLGGPRLSDKGRWNPKGNREPKRLIRLHESILASNGGAWFDPPDRVEWTDEHRERRDSFIRSRADQRIWGFKDPRTLLVIDGWLEALPDLEMVASVREPMAVAKSLQRRKEQGDHRSEQGSLEDWLTLWLQYNERLLALHERYRFPVIDFDAAPDRYQLSVERLIEGLSLRAPSEGERFFDATLRSSEAPAEEELPEDVERVYRRLKEIAAA